MKKYMKFFISAASLLAINTPVSLFSTLPSKPFDVLEVLVADEINYTLTPTQQNDTTVKKDVLHEIFYGSLPYAESMPKSKEEYLQSPTNTDTSILNENSDVQDGNYHNGNPTVLIYHTHTTEAYCEDITSAIYRNSDSSKNMVMVGDIVAKVLHEEYGLEVLHVRQIFDSPYDGAYDRSLEACEQRTAEFPSITYAFDIHRDGLSPTETNREIYKANIQGIDTAKVMTVLGNLSENYADNRSFADLLGTTLNEMYPGMYKSTIEKQYRYNQFIADKGLLLEVGSNLSTPQEAQNAAVYLARAIGVSIEIDSSSQ